MIKKIMKYVGGMLLLCLILGKIGIVLFQAEEAEVFRKIDNKNVCYGLNYHRVKNPTMWNKVLKWTIKPDELTKYNVFQDEFEQQMDQLIAEGAYFATLEEVKEFRRKGEFPEKCVWISFDDVDESVYKYAYPILKERKIPFTLFVISKHVGNKDFSNLTMATWDELREMRDSGLASFGSHTHDMHYLEGEQAVFLNPNKYEAFETDIKESKRVLEQELEIPITTIAYPFGIASKEIIDIVNNSEFTEGAILQPLPIDVETSSYELSRYVVSESNFVQILSLMSENK